MEISVDSFFTMGKSHKVCQDYALHGTEPFPFVIVSDGCSSSPNTDVGARILCNIARQNLNLLFEKGHTIFGEVVIHSAARVVLSLGLDITCLDATLIIGCFIQEEFSHDMHVFSWGDGFCVLGNTRNDQEHFQFEYTHNAPFYLSYLLDRNRLSVYKKSSVDHDFVRKWFPDFVQKQSCVNSHGHSELMGDSCRQKSEENISPRMLVIASDGLDSFQSTQTGEKVDCQETLESTVAFKSMKGQFITRRIGRMLKTYNKQGIVPTDDVSVAGISVSY